MSKLSKIISFHLIFLMIFNPLFLESRIFAQEGDSTEAEESEEVKNLDETRNQFNEMYIQVLELEEIKLSFGDIVALGLLSWSDLKGWNHYKSQIDEANEAIRTLKEEFKVLSEQIDKGADEAQQAFQDAAKALTSHTMEEATGAKGVLQDALRSAGEKLTDASEKIGAFGEKLISVAGKISWLISISMPLELMGNQLVDISAGLGAAGESLIAAADSAAAADTSLMGAILEAAKQYGENYVYEALGFDQEQDFLQQLLLAAVTDVTLYGEVGIGIGIGATGAEASLDLITLGESIVRNPDGSVTVTGYVDVGLSADGELSGLGVSASAGIGSEVSLTYNPDGTITIGTAAGAGVSGGGQLGLGLYAGVDANYDGSIGTEVSMSLERFTSLSPFERALLLNPAGQAAMASKYDDVGLDLVLEAGPSVDGSLFGSVEAGAGVSVSAEVGVSRTLWDGTQQVVIPLIGSVDSTQPTEPSVNSNSQDADAGFLGGN